MMFGDNIYLLDAGIRFRAFRLIVRESVNMQEG